MEKQCIICDKSGIYKCPTCLIYYCSARCCQKHRENQCDVAAKPERLPGASGHQLNQKYITADTVPLEKLSMLKGNETLNNLLCNPHLRELLLTVNSSKNPEEIMQKVMLEPLFVEFADTCLKVVQPLPGICSLILHCGILFRLRNEILSDVIMT